MIRFSLEHLAFLEEHIQNLDEAIAAKIRKLGYVQPLELLKTLPGFQQTTASSVLAEIGPDMEQVRIGKAAELVGRDLSGQ